ncbi:MAG: hypothetical protein ACOC84_09635 [Actinomycetota bacterium]
MTDETATTATTSTTLWRGVRALRAAAEEADLPSREARRRAIEEEAEALGLDLLVGEAESLAAVGPARHAWRAWALAIAAVEDGGEDPGRVAALLRAYRRGSGGGLADPGAGSVRPLTYLGRDAASRLRDVAPGVAAQGGAERTAAASGSAWTAAAADAAAALGLPSLSVEEVQCLLDTMARERVLRARSLEETAETSVVSADLLEEAADLHAEAHRLREAADVLRRQRLRALADSIA